MQSCEMNQLHLIVTILFSLILGTNSFSYKEAKNWGKQYPECNGKHQSPISFKSEDRLSFTRINQKLKLTDFNKLPTKMTIKNTGHTVEIKADWSGKPPRFTGGPLHGNYVFDKATFHWGPKGGAEHIEYDTESKENFDVDIEMNMYFYKSDLKSLEKAQSQKGGLAVIAAWLRTGYGNPEHLFDKLETSLNKVKSINSTTGIPPFRLASLVDAENVPFISYEGSLNFPPCTESVTWFIYDFDVCITDGLLNGFKKIKLAEGDVSNIRPTQPRNKRPVQIIYHSENKE